VFSAYLGIDTTAGAAPRRPSAAASSDFYARNPAPGRPGGCTCFPDPGPELVLSPEPDLNAFRSVLVV
jgi:hypothetical protein